ncbi:hypothetical protein LY76DRAFT_588205 [Colletotrichum caudatum]|nr:hypothetical protein LY76DRAFT_588205 [Colletotrichum caudatum]
MELIREICCQMRNGHEVDYCRYWAPEQMTLANFCRTSKACDHIARPVLYNRIEISLSQNTLPSLIRTLASRSDLSQIVKHVKLKPHGGNRYTANPIPGDDDIVRFADIFQQWWPEGLLWHPDFYHALCQQKKLADVVTS